MTTKTTPVSCTSSFSSFWQCLDTKTKNLQSTTFGVFEHLKTLEKEPKISGDILENWKKDTEEAYTSFRENPNLGTLANLGATAGYSKQTATDISSSFVGIVSEFAKKSLRQVADGFFYIFPLPLPIPPEHTSPFNFKALTAITGFVVAGSACSAISEVPQREKWIDLVMMGTTVGTTMSWIFNQNLYLGAISGTLTGLLTPWTPITTNADKALTFLSGFATQYKVQQFVSSFKWNIIVPTLAFGAALASAAQSSPEIDLASALLFSMIPAGISYALLFSQTIATQKILSRAHNHLGPIAWTSYASLALSSAIQHTISYLANAPSETS